MASYDGILDPVPDPEMEAYARMVVSRGTAFPDPMSVDIAAARRIIEAVNVPLAEGGPRMAVSEDRWLPVRGRYMLCRIHVPVGLRGPAAVLVYLHGSGWTWNSVYTHDRVMREYAARGNSVVIGPNYALSPEAPFPQAIDECVAFIVELRRVCADWTIDPDRMLLGGDSAGANLALSAMMVLRDSGADFIRGALLSYGVYDSDFERPSYRAFGSGRELLSTARMRWYWKNYVGSGEGQRQPLATPLHGDLTALPPIMLQIAGMDVLLDENVELARRLAAAGVDHEAWIYPGLFHSFLRACPFVRRAMEAIDDGAAWLQRQADRAPVSALRAARGGCA